MVTLEEFIQNVTQWGKTRGIYGHSTWQDQLEKWGEERAEMLYAETMDELMDAFGDQAVCLVHCMNMCDYDERQRRNLDVALEIEGIEAFLADRDFTGAVWFLMQEAARMRVDFAACLNMAWESIRDRKGLMVAGKFVKYENLTDEQRSLCDETQGAE